MNLRKAGLVAVLGAGLSGAGAVFLAFGPDLLVNFLSQDKEREQSEAVRRQNELLEQNAQLLAGLNKTLSQQAPVPQPAADVPAPQVPDEPEPAISVTTTPENAPAVTTDETVQSPDLLATRPRTPPGEMASEKPAATPAAEPDIGIDMFGVFPGQKFALCGHDGFTAELLVADAAAQIMLKSPDRSIPGAGFRGFEARLPARQPTELWAGCTVATDHSTTSGVTRIAISTTRGDET